MPDFRDYVRQNLPPLGVSGAREAEIVEELAEQFQEAYDRALRNGLTAEEAWNEAAKRVSSWPELGRELETVLHERQEDERPRRPWDGLRHDVRYGLRQLRKSPGFTLVAVLTLALGIGANTAIFSLLDAVLLRSLPVRHPDQLVWLGDPRPTGSTEFYPNRATAVFSYRFAKEFQRQNEVFSDVAAISSVLYGTHGRVAGSKQMEKIGVELVTGSYFRTLGVSARLGRALTDADDRTPGAHPIGVASHSWWQRRFGGDPSIIGKTVTIASTMYTIVGVAQPGFSGATVGNSPDLWIPLAMEKEISPGWNGLDEPWFQSLHMIGRPKPGIALAQVQANANGVFRRILLGFLGPQSGSKAAEDIQHAYIQLTPAGTGRSHLRGEFGSPLEILMAVVALVLLIASANVANLLLARATARQREIAVRMSVGAARSRLIRQLLVESGMLGAAGAVLGVGLAWAASRLLLAMVSVGNELLPINVSPDPTVLAFTVAVASLTVLLFGTAPAFHATSVDFARTLQEGRGMVSSRSRNRLSRGLVVAQVTLSMLLLAGSGLFLRSLSNLSNIDPGFDKHNVLYLGLNPAAAGYQPDARLESMMQRVEERIGSLSGMHGASFAMNVFDGGGWSGDDVVIPGRPESEKTPRTVYNLVGPAYLDIMKMPILLGRNLNAHDTAGSPKVAVVNESFARAFFPGMSPLGRTFSQGDDGGLSNIQIVGVAKDAKYMSLDEEQMPAVFYPHSQHPVRILYRLVARYTGESRPLVADIRKALADIDPSLPVSNTTTLAKVVEDSVQNKRVVAQLSTFFGMVAAFLACIGIYGVMSYAIARRTNEFGVRIALGASRHAVLWAVLRETVLLACFGVAAGLALALSAGQLVQSLLFGLQPYDPLVLSAATLAMIAVALLAGFLPARRATRIDPSAALRCE